jgi:cell division septation protein DedD
VSDASCPHCGEPVERRQLVCLNCGGRVALKERPSLAREPVTIVAAVLLAVIVLGAGLFGFAISELTSGDGDETADRTPGRAAAEAPAVVAGEEQPPRTAEEEAPAATPEPADRNEVPGWPQGLRAHTVVLVTSSDRAAALNVAREARSTGLEAGLIRSDRYDLGTGLWIVYSGQFTTPEGAERQATQLAERYPGAYPQLVQRSQ